MECKKSSLKIISIPLHRDKLEEERRGQYVILINKSLVTTERTWSIKLSNFKGIYNYSSLSLACTIIPPLCILLHVLSTNSVVFLILSLPSSFTNAAWFIIQSTNLSFLTHSIINIARFVVGTICYFDLQICHLSTNLVLFFIHI